MLNHGPCITLIPSVRQRTIPEHNTSTTGKPRQHLHNQSWGSCVVCTRTSPPTPPTLPPLTSVRGLPCRWLVVPVPGTPPPSRSAPPWTSSLASACRDGSAWGSPRASWAGQLLRGQGSGVNQGVGGGRWRKDNRTGQEPVDELVQQLSGL